MDREEELDRLLDRWQQHREEGRPISPEELCREAPELLPTLRLRIDAVARIEGLLGDPPLNTTPPVRERGARETLIVGVPSPPKAPPGYELHGELGRGGVGVVYKAKQLSLKRLVALKMLLTGAHASAEDRRRFRREAETIARLAHPNIVQVHEIGEYDGRAYLSLEYIDGGSLADRLRQQPMAPRRAAELVRTLAAAVEAAHKASVVHRDLKPANVLMSAGGVPKISDFGLAKHLDDEYGRTGSGAIMGTPAYMAPEQAGGVGSVGPAVDVYALGAILYECLTGQVPFRAASMMDLLDLVRHADPVAPTRLNARIPRDLETVCLKCLRKDHAARYASAADLADDLGRYLAGQPIQARPVGLVERGASWARRHRGMTAALASLALAGLALVVAGFWFSARLGAARAAGDVSDARADAAEAQLATSREVARSAERLAQTQRFFQLVTQARERLARPEPGWRARALADLAEAARLPDAADHLLDLRGEAVACLGGLDARPGPVLSDLPRAISVAGEPGGRRLAVGERALNIFVRCQVHLIDPDDPGRRLRLVFPQRWGTNSQGKKGMDNVATLAFSPDGQRLAAGTRGGMLHVWDLRASPPARTSRLAYPKTAVEKVLFSRDGRSLYTLDGSLLKRWGAAELAEAESAPAASRGLARHPAEGWLAVRDHAQTLRLHPETLKPVGPPLGTAGRVFAFGADGRALYLADGRSAWAWDVAGNRLAQQFRAPDQDFAHEQGISDLAVSPDGTLLATASDHTHHARLWDLVSGRLVADVPVGSGQGKVAFASDGRSVVMLAEDRALVHEVSGREEQTVAARRPMPLQALAMAGGALACVSEGSEEGHGEIAYWASLDPAAAPGRVVPFAPSATTYPMGLSANGRWLGVLNAGSHRLHLEDTLGERGPGSASLADEGRSLSVAPDGRLWAAVGDEVRAWDVPALAGAASWQNKYGIVMRGASAIRGVSAGRRWVVAAGQDGLARVFPAGRGELRPAATRELLSRLPLWSAALSPDETLAVVGAANGQRWLLRVPSAEVVTELPACPDAVECLAWGADDVVASGCRDGKVTLYHREGEKLRELFTARHPRSLRAMALDGPRLGVLLTGERGVRVWHLDRVRKKLTELGLWDRGEPREAR